MQAKQAAVQRMRDGMEALAQVAERVLAGIQAAFQPSAASHAACALVPEALLAALDTTHCLTPLQEAQLQSDMAGACGAASSACAAAYAAVSQTLQPGSSGCAGLQWLISCLATGIFALIHSAQALSMDVQVSSIAANTALAAETALQLLQSSLEPCLKAALSASAHDTQQCAEHAAALDAACSLQLKEFCCSLLEGVEHTGLPPPAGRHGMAGTAQLLRRFALYCAAAATRLTAFSAPGNAALVSVNRSVMEELHASSCELGGDLLQPDALLVQDEADLRGTVEELLLAAPAMLHALHHLPAQLLHGYDGNPVALQLQLQTRLQRLGHTFLEPSYLCMLVTKALVAVASSATTQCEGQQVWVPGVAQADADLLLQALERCEALRAVDISAAGSESGLSSVSVLALTSAVGAAAAGEGLGASVAALQRRLGGAAKEAGTEAQHAYAHDVLAQRWARLPRSCLRACISSLQEAFQQAAESNAATAVWQCSLKEDLWLTTNPSASPAADVQLNWSAITRYAAMQGPGLVRLLQDRYNAVHMAAQNMAPLLPDFADPSSELPLPPGLAWQLRLHEVEAVVLRHGVIDVGELIKSMYAFCPEVLSLQHLVKEYGSVGRDTLGTLAEPMAGDGSAAPTDDGLPVITKMLHADSWLYRQMHDVVMAEASRLLQSASLQAAATALQREGERCTEVRRLRVGAGRLASKVALPATGLQGLRPGSCSNHPNSWHKQQQPVNCTRFTEMPGAYTAFLHSL